MKITVAYILIAIGTLGLIIQVFYRIQREKSHLELQMQTQQSSLVDGLKAAWRTRLLEEARLGNLKPTFFLRWDRKGVEPRDVYFPFKKSILDWTKYREFVESKNEEKIKYFLLSALERKNSWDRVLAMTEWQGQYGIYPQFQTEYEHTLVNSEAKAAYQLIFEQFSGDKDFTYASADITYDKVFFYVAKDGSIEAFVPSLQEIREKVLSKFIAENNLSSAKVTINPWNLVLPPSLTEKFKYSYSDFLWTILAIFCFLVGIVVYFISLREQKKFVIKKITFLNQIVHELKTPLTGIKLHLQLIQKGLGNKDNLRALETSIDRLNFLFDDIILMNRPFEKVEAKLIMPNETEKIFSNFEIEFPQLKIERSTLFPFHADEKRLRIILRNLIKNGIKYGQTVTVRMTKEERNIAIFIKDNGPGISEHERQNIFKEFYRSESARKANVDGLGLGLYLAKKMAEEIGATIALVNPGDSGGAEFRLTLIGQNDD